MCKDFLWDYIQDLLSCSDNLELSDSEIKIIIDRLINNDKFWCCIDDFIYEEIDNLKDLNNY